MISPKGVVVTTVNLVSQVLCILLGMELSQADAELVGWLVAKHLLIITNRAKEHLRPEVVAAFADQVGNVTYLNYLYVLTVADMNATNPAAGIAGALRRCANSIPKRGEFCVPTLMPQ